MIELQAWDTQNNNVCLHKSVTTYLRGATCWFGGKAEVLVDGIIGDYLGADGPFEAIVDTGAKYYIKYLKAWLYYADSRTYRNVTLKTSKDNKNWVQVYKKNTAFNSSGLRVDI